MWCNQYHILSVIPYVLSISIRESSYVKMNKKKKTKKQSKVYQSCWNRYDSKQRCFVYITEINLCWKWLTFIKWLTLIKRIDTWKWLRRLVINTVQLHPTKPELRFCAGSNPARGVSEIHVGEGISGNSPNWK